GRYQNAHSQCAIPHTAPLRCGHEIASLALGPSTFPAFLQHARSLIGNTFLRHEGCTTPINTAKPGRAAAFDFTCGPNLKECAMLPLRTIMHPTDFSEPSDYAFRLACSLARDYRAQLIVLHVLERPLRTYSGVLMAPPPLP